MVNILHVAKFSRFSFKDCVCPLFLADVRQRIKAREVLSVLEFLGFMNVNSCSLTT